MKLVNRIKGWMRKMDAMEGGFKADPRGAALSWFNNRMSEMLMDVQLIRSMDAEKLMLKRIRYRHFLTDLKGHFVGSRPGKPLWNAFKYLSLYFKHYPNVTQDHSRTAVQMIDRIYKVLGLELPFNKAPQPRLSAPEKIRREFNLLMCKLFPLRQGTDLLLRPSDVLASRRRTSKNLWRKFELAH